jgi:hypothetical protein
MELVRSISASASCRLHRRERADLVPLTGVLGEAQTELWLLTHSEVRHLRRWAPCIATWRRRGMP